MVWVTLALLAVAVGGCTTPAEPVRAAPAEILGASLDPCADRLHEIGGQLLVYYAIHKELPGRLEDLNAGRPPGERLSFVCPQNGKAYVYDPQGIEVEGVTGCVIVYDAEPIHTNMRWCLTFEEPCPGHRLASDVIRLPDAKMPQAGLPKPATIPATGPAGR